MTRFLEIPGVSPKHAKLIYEQLSIKTVEELKRAAEEGRLSALHGLGKKVEQNILQGIQQVQKYKERLDMSDIHCRKAKEKGIRIAISTDAHMDEHLGWMQFGVATARRGWIEPKDVINSGSFSKVLKYFRH